jgi:hypothetical protein
MGMNFIAEIHVIIPNVKTTPRAKYVLEIVPIMIVFFFDSKIIEVNKNPAAFIKNII